MKLSQINQPNKGFVSPLTIGFGIYIIISASFMRQVWGFLSNVFGKNNLQMFCMLVYVLAGIIIISYIIKFRFHILRLTGVMLCLILSLLFAWRQPYFVEKMHVLEYGALGWLAIRDLRRNPRRNIAMTILFSFIFVLIIGGLDEGFQKLLPYRVGEIRDVMTNLISSSLGIVLFLLS